MSGSVGDDAWANAQTHLTQAQALDAARSPAVLVHACYYAMFHAARACLLKTTGAAPKRHDQVIRQFAVLVKDGDETARQAGVT